MIDRILFNDGIGEARAALLDGGAVQEIRIEREDRRSRAGDIVLGRVQRVVPSLKAAFVDLGFGRAGFLGTREAMPIGRAKGRDADTETPIERLVHEGEAVLVQITTDAHGDKGPRVTAEISLAGRTVALTPMEPGIRVSRKIADAGERTRLTGAVEAGLADAGLGEDRVGVVVRTAAEGLDGARLGSEIASLAGAWAELAAKARMVQPPALLRPDAGLLGRLLRDIVTGAVTRFEVDTTDALQRAHRLAATFCPEFKDRIVLHPGGPALFEDEGVEAEIEAALQPKVLLPGGAWISIEATEGFTAIDVNAGGGAETGSSKSPSMDINMAAAREIARQIRLRSISGLIVVDFIHVADRPAAMRLTRALESALAADPVHSRVSPMSDVGLVEITRRREHESLSEMLETACPTCGGHGHVLRVDTEAQAILRWAERAARRPGADIVVPVSAAVAERLTVTREGASLVSRLEARIGKRVRLETTH